MVMEIIILLCGAVKQVGSYTYNHTTLYTQGFPQLSAPLKQPLLKNHLYYKNEISYMR